MTDVGIDLVYDSISPNTGDMAIGLANRQLLEARGVSARISDPLAPQPDRIRMVGGGELLRATGDPFYDAFRVPGANILHAIGVHPTADSLDYLGEYPFVSARSTEETEVLRPFAPDARTLPCSTTLLTSPDFQPPELKPGEHYVGIHLAPHALRLIGDLVDIVDAIPGKKVLLPFTHYNGDSSFMSHLPLDRRKTVELGVLKPLELHAVIRRFSYVLTTSLHASLFAYAQGVPFVSIHQPKVRAYFADRGLADQVVSTRDELRAALRRARRGRPATAARQLTKDREALEVAFDEYATWIHSEPRRSVIPLSGDHGRTTAHLELLLDQSRGVIRDHDLTIAYAEARRRQLVAETRALRHRIVGDGTAVEVRSGPWYIRGLRFARRTLRRLRARLK